MPLLYSFSLSPSFPPWGKGKRGSKGEEERKEEYEKKVARGRGREAHEKGLEMGGGIGDLRVICTRRKWIWGAEFDALSLDDRCAGIYGYISNFFWNLWRFLYRGNGGEGGAVVAGGGEKRKGL